MKSSKNTVFGIFDYSFRPKLNQLLKPLGLRLKTKGNYRNWGDQVLASIELAEELSPADSQPNTWKFPKGMWTDYPCEYLGDKPGQPAPLRWVTVLSYDGDKYCEVVFGRGVPVVTIKAGYLYEAHWR